MPDREKHLWQEQARHLGGQELVETIEAMALDIHSIKKSMSELTNSAFPGGDLAGHKRYHDLVIERTAEIRRLRIAIQEKTLSGLVWAFIAFMGLCVFKTVAGYFAKGV